MDLLSRDKGYMEYSLFKSIIDQVAPSLFYLNLYFQGEPYLHPEFAEMVKYARSKHITVSTSTNGHFLTAENVEKTIDSGLNKLIISLDGADANTYEQYRQGGKFQQVVDGIKEMVKQKAMTCQGPTVVLQSLILRSNQEQLKEIRELRKELGVDKVELKTAQFYDFQEGNMLMPDGRFSRYSKMKSGTDGKTRYTIRNRMPNHCFRMWSSAVITWDGTVVPCCFDKDATNKMGDLNKESFKDCWGNEDYKEFRKKILSSRKSIDICTNCTEGMGISFLF